LLQLSINPHPVAKMAVWFQHRLEPMAVERSFLLPPARATAVSRSLSQASAK
jgi:hypothetical protein